MDVSRSPAGRTSISSLRERSNNREASLRQRIARLVLEVLRVSTIPTADIWRSEQHDILVSLAISCFRRRLLTDSAYSWHRAAGRQIQPGQKIHASVIFLSDSYKPQAVLPLRDWKDLIPSSNKASWSCPFEGWSSWVESDLYDISRAIIKGFESLPEDASLVSRQLKQLIAFGACKEHMRLD